jgi:predicted nucleotidyltransferase
MCRPASETEEQRISRAIRMIKDAVNSSNELKDKNTEVFVQGSYANNTNVKAESDVDVCVMLKDTFYSKYAEGMTQKDYGFTKGTNDFKTYRKDNVNAAKNKYGEGNVKPGNKSIKVVSNSARVESDLVPSFQYRNYAAINSCDPEKYVEGVKFYSNNNNEVINYPKPHIKNGIVKNDATKRRYKRQVRLLKRMRYMMIEQGWNVNGGISSFLIECLLYNTPNDIFNSHDTYEMQLKEAIIYLYNETRPNGKAQNWKEVSGMIDLFGVHRKWDVPMVNEFLKQVWNFIGF